MNSKEEAKRRAEELHKETVERVTSENSLVLDSMLKEHQRKSAVARALLEEREEEVEALRRRVEELQKEISSGSHHERRIMELAQRQANRDASLGMYRY